MVCFKKKCDRGTGQGNTDSPTCWNAVFDIALTALSFDSQFRGTEHFATAANGNIMQSSEIGYADDLVSVHGLATEIHRKAEIMSPFCLICVVTLSYKKLRRAVQHWIGSTRPEHHLLMKIYEYGWTPRDITIKVDGATEFLGGLHDLQHTGIPQAEAAEDVARLHRIILDDTYASGTTKLLCLSVAITPKILYKHNINSLSLKRTLDTDKIFYPLLLQASHHMWDFPKNLLRLSPDYYGLGISSVTDRTFIKKWATLQTALHSDGPHASAAEGLLYRAAASQGTHLIANQGVVLTAPSTYKRQDPLVGQRNSRMGPVLGSPPLQKGISSERLWDRGPGSPPTTPAYAHHLPDAPSRATRRPPGNRSKLHPHLVSCFP